MATQHTNLAADSVTNLTTELSLTDGTAYLMQVLGGPVYLAEAASAPSVGADSAHLVTPPTTWQVTPESGTALYAWGNGRVVVTEA